MTKPATYPTKAARRIAALELGRASEGLEVVHLRVAREHVVFVKGVLEASDGLGCMFSERGGELTLAAPASRARELHELAADLAAELDGELSAAGGKLRSSRRDTPTLVAAAKLPSSVAGDASSAEPDRRLRAREARRTRGLVSAAKNAAERREAPAGAVDHPGGAANPETPHLPAGARDAAAHEALVGAPAADAATSASSSLPPPSETPTPPPHSRIEARALQAPLAAAAAGLDPRVTAAWGKWLSALATDAEAALAAAQVYDALDGAARDALLDALIDDMARLGVPRVAVFAPLLAVERDPARADRISRELAEKLGQGVGPLAGDVAAGAPAQAAKPRAYRGPSGSAFRALVLVAPVYLDFVRILRCRYSVSRGFDDVELEALSSSAGSRSSSERFAGAPLERIPLKVAIEDLSLAILAQRRSGAEIPRELRLFADLFGAHPERE